MQHCQNTVYATDLHCCDCGEALEQKRQMHTVEELSPDLLVDVKNYAPQANTITGVVKSTYYYKRRYKTNNDNMLYGYWWLEVEDKDGIIHEFSVDAEKDVIANLQKGNVITAFQETPLTLNYRIADGNARRVVKNDRFMPVVIVHFADQQYRSWDKTISRNYTGGTILWLVLSVITFLIMLFAAKLEFLPALLASLPVAIGVFMAEHNYHKKAKAKQEAKYDAILAATDVMLSTTLNQLGYNMLARTPSKSDVICISCQQRISQDAAHCYCCGAKQHVEAIAEKEQSLAKDDEQAISIQKALEPSITKPTSIAELEHAIMDEYSLTYENAYEHKNVWARNEKGTISHCAVLGKVLEKEQSAHANETRETVTTTETTTTYRGGTYVGSDVKERVEVYRNRSTTLKGEIMLETASGEPFVFKAGEDLLGSVDIGDWVYYAYSSVDTKRYYKYYREYAVNVSKDITYDNSSVRSFGMVHGFNRMVLLGLTSIGLAWYFDAQDFYPLVNTLVPDVGIDLLNDYPQVVEHLDGLPVAVFIVLSVVTGVWGFIYSQINGSRLKRSVKKLESMITKFSKQFGKVSEQINKLN
ncbi:MULTISPECIES: hypothetical protein [Pseudoalteromonas]|uniref:hypothetical protein n=1 Tax=Pseudoalteromonas TaxID=53246 RepID=UPI001582DAA2|nr:MULTISPECIES: hypothetical protein [Pseudoalteromonas]MDI4652889.1 hypothetical protein [Pseudoalteromonas shioyasakiensis]NUJ38877.1 hypothetical protein [Pseudoalteromonas sp. 0303]